MATAPSSVPAARGPGVYGSYVDEVLAYTIGQGAQKQTFYPHYNHLYSVAALMDAMGNVVERYRYDAYGKQTITSSTGVVRAKSAVGFDRGFTGYVADNETSLSYARGRMYSSSLGRFVNRDPTEIQFKQEDGLIVEYAYIRYRDGANLYMAYFVPGSLDPTGFAETGGNPPPPPPGGGVTTGGNCLACALGFPGIGLLSGQYSDRWNRWMNKFGRSELSVLEFATDSLNQILMLNGKKCRFVECAPVCKCDEYPVVVAFYYDEPKYRDGGFHAIWGDNSGWWRSAYGGGFPGESGPLDPMAYLDNKGKAAGMKNVTLCLCCK